MLISPLVLYFYGVGARAERDGVAAMAREQASTLADLAPAMTWQGKILSMFGRWWRLWRQGTLGTETREEIILP